MSLNYRTGGWIYLASVWHPFFGKKATSNFLVYVSLTFEFIFLSHCVLLGMSNTTWNALLTFLPSPFD